MPNAMVVEWVSEKYQTLRGALNERSRRLWAAAEARSLGRGGAAAVLAATGMSSATVSKGLAELEEAQLSGEVLSPKRIRKPGAGRKRATDKQPGLARALQRLVDNHVEIYFVPPQHGRSLKGSLREYIETNADQDLSWPEIRHEAWSEAAKEWESGE